MHSIKHVSVVLNVLCRMWSEAWDRGVMSEKGTVVSVWEGVMSRMWESERTGGILGTGRYNVMRAVWSSKSILRTGVTVGTTVTSIGAEY